MEFKTLNIEDYLHKSFYKVFDELGVKMSNRKLVLAGHRCVFPQTEYRMDWLVKRSSDVVDIPDLKAAGVMVNDKVMRVKDTDTVIASRWGNAVMLGENGEEVARQLIPALDKYNMFPDKPYNYKITFGADPEFIVVAKRSRRKMNAASLLQDTSEDLMTSDVGVDGHSSTLELRPRYSTTVGEFVSNYKKTLSKLADIIGDRYYVYSGGGAGFNEPTGGHIHIGGIYPSKYLIDLLDNFVGAPLMAMRNGQRPSGSGYGRLSEFRMQRYGLEYRSPPSFFKTPEMVDAVYSMVSEITDHVKGVEDFKGGKLEAFTPSESVQKKYDAVEIPSGDLMGDILRGVEIAEPMMEMQLKVIGEFHTADWYKLPKPVGGHAGTIDTLIYGSKNDAEINLFTTPEYAKYLPVLQKVFLNYGYAVTTTPPDLKTIHPVNIGIPLGPRRKLVGGDVFKKSKLVKAVNSALDTIIVIASNDRALESFSVALGVE